MLDNVNHSFKDRYMKMLLDPVRKMSNDDRALMAEVLEDAMSKVVKTSPTNLACGIQVMCRARDDLYKEGMLNSGCIRCV